MVHVLDVVVIFHQVDHLGHVLDVVLVGELDVVLGNHLDAGGGEHIALLLQCLDDGVEVNLTIRKNIFLRQFITASLFQKA